MLHRCGRQSVSVWTEMQTAHCVELSQTVDAISCKVCTFFVKSEVRIKPSKSAETGHPGQGKSHRPRPLWKIGLDPKQSIQWQHVTIKAIQVASSSIQIIHGERCRDMLLGCAMLCLIWRLAERNVHSGRPDERKLNALLLTKQKMQADKLASVPVPKRHNRYKSNRVTKNT